MGNGLKVPWPPRNSPAPRPVTGSNKLFTRAPTLWSSPSRRDDPEMLPARLANAYFLDLVELSLKYGTDYIETVLESIKDEMHPVQYRIEREMLDNIIRGFEDSE